MSMALKASLIMLRVIIRNHRSRCIVVTNLFDIKRSGHNIFPPYRPSFKRHISKAPDLLNGDVFKFKSRIVWPKNDRGR